MIKKYRKLSGFTVVEILVVTAIIGVLAAAAVLNFSRAQTRSEYSETKASILNYLAAIEMYRQDTKYYPRDDAVPAGLDSYAGKTVNNSTFVDAWGSTMDWDNWCNIGGTLTGRYGSGACPENSDLPAGPIGIHAKGPDKTWIWEQGQPNGPGGDDIFYGSRGYYVSPDSLWD